MALSRSSGSGMGVRPLRPEDEPVAEAVVSVGPDRTAMVDWIETCPTHRGRGLGREPLGEAPEPRSQPLES